MSFILPLAWALIIGFGIVMYVILDGFTLGTGILFPFLKQNERDTAISVLLPTWDGNQTWLVLGGASLYGAFPIVYSSLLPVLYLPLMIMIIALLFRGVVFEFRLKSKHPHNWDFTFAISSLIIALIQGIVLGNFIQGFVFTQYPYLASSKSLINLFDIFAGFGLVIGYTLLGSTRLIFKTSDTLQNKMYFYAKLSTILVGVCLIIASIWTPFLNHQIYVRWFEEQNWVLLMILPYIGMLAGGVLLWSLYKHNEVAPFWASVILFLCAYVGFLISIYPYIIPYQLTIWQAAAPTNSLLFMLFGAIIMIPILLLYTAYAYYIFRGKVKDVIHY